MRGCGITRIVPDPEQPVTLDGWPALASGPALQVEHLYESGHRRIGFAATADPRKSLLLDPRVRTAQHAATGLGLDPLDVRPVDRGVESAREAVRHWREAGVTGVAARTTTTPRRWWWARRSERARSSPMSSR